MNIMTKTLTFFTLLVWAFAAGVVLTSNSASQAFEAWSDTPWMEQFAEALEANNYDLLSDEAKAKIDEEQFAEKVERKATHDEAKAELTEIVKANDFAWFQAHVEENKANKEAKMIERAAESGKELKERKVRPEPTEEELREKFDAMVAYYEENWELKQKGKRGWHGFGKGWGCEK